MTLIARESFHAGGRFVAAGTEVDADDPIVIGRLHLFEPENPVEQATAEPGEKRRRSVKRPAARSTEATSTDQAKD